ncbi:Imm8 family immunity protein [Cupriavidus gilardii]|uniref:Imm8 family immunity protein n=1 Tax=Cupriavidus gilardii TaxID=82541 RepID=UPI003F68ACC7
MDSSVRWPTRWKEERRFSTYGSAPQSQAAQAPLWGRHMLIVDTCDYNVIDTHIERYITNSEGDDRRTTCDKAGRIGASELRTINDDSMRSAPATARFVVSAGVVLSKWGRKCACPEDCRCCAGH